MWNGNTSKMKTGGILGFMMLGPFSMYFVQIDVR
jgi:hypothetical protein